MEKKRLCQYSKCRKPLPENARRDRKFCNSTCRARAFKEKHAGAGAEALKRIAALEAESSRRRAALQAEIDQLKIRVLSLETNRHDSGDDWKTRKITCRARNESPTRFTPEE